MIKLKPCPFCGGEAEVERQGTSRQSCIISCTECGCRHEGPDEYEQCGYQWNMRDTPTTSLARHKLLWQAEAVETAVARGYRSRDELAGWAEHLRRQAEEDA